MNSRRHPVVSALPFVSGSTGVARRAAAYGGWIRPCCAGARTEIIPYVLITWWIARANLGRNRQI